MKEGSPTECDMRDQHFSILVDSWQEITFGSILESILIESLFLAFG